VAEDESILTRGAKPPDRELSYGPGPLQTVELRQGRAGAALPLVVLIHGGFWRPDIDRAHARPMADAMAAAGWSVALPEYARVPGDPAATLQDLEGLLVHSAGWPIVHSGALILVGHSAGGHLALLAGAAGLCPQLCGTLALAPVADLALAQQLQLGRGAVARFLGAALADRDRFDPARMASPPTPTTLVHGSEDAIVPLAVSQSYIAEHPAARLNVIAGAGHFALIDPDSAAWSTVIPELARLAA
jgi:acetyl esterase/lipase